jgi:hypothetical protein
MRHRRDAAILLGLGTALVLPAVGRAQATAITTYTDAASFTAAVGPLTTIDFETLGDASSCPSPIPQAPLANPLTLSGVTFTDPVCLDTSIFGALNDSLLCLHAGGTIAFPAGTTGVLLNVTGIGPDSGTVRFTDATGATRDLTIQGVPFQLSPGGATSPKGITTVQVLTAPNVICFSSVLFTTAPLRIGPPVTTEECKDDGWQRFNNPSFKNQGECVSFVQRTRPSPRP